MESGDFRTEDRQSPSDPVDGQANRVVGWASMLFGAALGAVIGLWSFDGPLPTPGWIGEYGDTSRRMIRLAHIAGFGLGIINILMSYEMPKLVTSARLRRGALHFMNFGNVFLPLTLLTAATYHPLKYLMPLPATAVFLALVVVVHGVWASRGGA